MVTDATRPDDPIIYVNRALELITGYGSREVMGRNPRFLQAGDHDQPTLDALRKARGGDDVRWAGVLRNYRKDGTLFFNELSVAAVRDEGGRVTHHLGLISDVTERERAGERLRFQAQLLDAVGQAVVAVDLRGRISYWNRAAEGLYGWSAEEAVGRPADEVMVSEEQTERAGEIWGELSAGRSWSGEFEVRRRDGTVFSAAVTDTPVFDERGNLTGVIGVSADITERKEAEEALRRSGANLAQAQRLANLGSWDWDVRTGKTAWSDEVYRILGFAPREFEPSFGRFFGAVHPDDRGMLRDAENAALREGEPYDLEHRLILPDGEVRVVHCRGEVAFGEGGEPLRMVGTVHDVTERVRTEEALKESEKRFRYMVRNSSDIITLVGADGTVRYSSPALERVLGYAPEERVGRNIFDLLHPDDAARARERYAEGHESPGVPLKIEVRQRHKDGSWRYVEVTGTNLLDDPSVEGFVLNSRDVTERVRAEEALREGERRFRQLFENSVDALLVVHPETREVVDCNQEACRSLGYPREELLGLHLEDFALEVLTEGEKRRRGPDTPWRRALAGEPGTIIGFHENVHRRKDGTTFPVEVGVGSIDYAGRRMILASCRDVTERKRAEEELRESEERYRAVVEQTAEGIYLLDVETRRVVEANAAFAELLGYAPGELPGMAALDFVTQDPKELEENIRRTLAEGRRFVGERRYRRRDGALVDVEVNVSVIYYGGREVICAAVRDVTERKRFEEALRKQNEYLVALHETALGLVDRLDLKDMLDVVLARAAALLGASDGYVFLAEPETLEVPLTVALGVYARYEGYPHIVRRGEGFGGRVWESGEPLVVNDYVSWPGRKRPAGFEAPRAVAGVPIESGPRVIGVLTLAHTDEGRRFGEDEVEVLRRFAAFAAIALHNAELYARARRGLAERERAEEALREGQARLAEAQRIARVGSWEYAVGENEAHWSDEMYRIFGRDPRSFAPTYRTFLRAVRPDYRALVLKMLRKALYEGRYYGHSAEFRIVRPDGEARAVHARYEVIREDEAGRPTRMTGTLQDVTERKALEERLEHQAFHDPLTGLANRALFIDRLVHALARADRRGETVAVLFLDLDNFKYVNDSLGHDAGDLMLDAVAERLKGCVRPEDTVARLGGDEFAVLLEGAEDAGGAIRVAERLTDVLQEPFDLRGRELFCATSVGIALDAAGRGRPEDLLRKADLALYEAKRQGKARYALFDPETERRSMRRLELENGLRRALERDEIVVRYQPVISLKSGRVAGFEALARWEHPMRGLITPDEFVPLAEENGLIVPIGERVLREACEHAEGWSQRHPSDPPLVVAVNLSAVQLKHPNLVGDVERILAESGLEPRRLTLEITESVLVEDAEQRHDDTLRGLRDLGVRLAIDDFGTGYSSLSYLKRLPAGLLKLDGLFVEGIGRGAEEDDVLLCGVVGIAHGLGLHVVAEAVEIAEQAARLRELGCDLAQGNYFSAPLPGEAVPGFLASYPRR